MTKTAKNTAKHENKTTILTKMHKVGQILQVELAANKLVSKTKSAERSANLSRLYSSCHKHEKGRKYARLAVKWTPETQKNSNKYHDLLAELANLEYVMGADNIAYGMYSELVTWSQAQNPENKEKTLHYRHMKGICLKKLGKIQEAMEELEQVQRELTNLGEASLRSMYNSRHHLAICRRLLNQPAEAEQENNRLLADQRILLGEHHEDCFATEIEIGRCGSERGNFDASDAWFADLYTRSKQALGDHPYPWIALGERSRTLAKLNHLTQAIELGQTALSGLSGLLGAGHPAARRQKKDLAHMLTATGRLFEGAEMRRELLEAAEKE